MITINFCVPAAGPSVQVVILAGTTVLLLVDRRISWLQARRRDAVSKFELACGKINLQMKIRSFWPLLIALRSEDDGKTGKNRDKSNCQVTLYPEYSGHPHELLSGVGTVCLEDMAWETHPRVRE